MSKTKIDFIDAVWMASGVAIIFVLTYMFIN